MDGCLKLAVLTQLNRKSFSGYSLMQAIREETGWKPSPGSMYPLLTALVKENLATVKAQGRRRVYAITKDGAAALQELLGQNRSRFERLASQIRVCSPNHPADKDIERISERLSKGEAPFGWLTHDVMEARKLTLDVVSKKLSDAEKQAVKKAFSALLTVMRNI